MMAFTDKLRDILRERKISTSKFSDETGISRKIFYDTGRTYHKATLMAIAYYLNTAVEDLISGTDAEDSWYR